jgi:hypothetical protein
MRDLRLLDAFRLDTTTVYGWSGDETCGAFKLPSLIDKADLLCIAASEGGWDHVSVSRINRCPNWPEMEMVKKAFFGKDEVVMQLHVPEAEHINQHPYCLHLWRPQHADIPRPPALMVGIVGEVPL